MDFDGVKKNCTTLQRSNVQVSLISVLTPRVGFPPPPPISLLVLAFFVGFLVCLFLISERGSGFGFLNQTSAISAIKLSRYPSQKKTLESILLFGNIASHRRDNRGYYDFYYYSYYSDGRKPRESPTTI